MNNIWIIIGIILLVLAAISYFVGGTGLPVVGLLIVAIIFLVIGGFRGRL